MRIYVCLTGMESKVNGYQDYDLNILLFKKKQDNIKQHIQAYRVDETEKNIDWNTIAFDKAFIATVNIGKKWEGSQLYYYPYATYAVEKQRNKGFGVLLYLCCLAAIKFDTQNIKTKAKLTRHCTVFPGFTFTTLDAARIYESLERKGIISQLPKKEFHYKINKYFDKLSFNNSQPLYWDNLIDIKNWKKYTTYESYINFVPTRHEAAK